MPGVMNYDPGQVRLSVGPVRVTGYADGTFVEVEQVEDTWKSKVGAGGEVTRTRMRNQLGKVKFTLQGSSPCNDLLMALFTRDKAQPTQFGIGPFSMRDGNGTTVCFGQVSWIVKPPKVEGAKEAPDREWDLEVASIDVWAGSNF